MATRDELKAQLRALEEQETSLSLKSKAYKWSKIFIIAVLVFIALVGTLGSMHWGPFSSFVMNDFVNFINSYKSILITFIGSIGVGGIAKNAVGALTNKFKKEEEEKKVADGEYEAKAGA